MEKTKIRNLVLFITVFVLTVAGIGGSFAASTSYSDLKTTHWAYKNVTQLSEKGIIKGYNDGTFKPSNTVTYGEFIKMSVVAMTGEDIGSIKGQHWAKSYYDEAVAEKYFTESDIPSTKLDKNIPRSDMALIVSGALADETLSADDTNKLQTYFTDITKVGDKKDEVIRACGLGIITGYVNGTFGPDKYLTRAESATVINRLIDKTARVYPSDAETGKIAELVTNYKDYEDLTYTTDYIFDDASKYNMSIKTKNGYYGIRHTLKGSLYLVKDGKVVEWTTTSPETGMDAWKVSDYESDVFSADYIVAAGLALEYDNKVYVVENPFKGKNLNTDFNSYVDKNGATIYTLK